MRSLEPQYDEDQYLQERYGDDELPKGKAYASRNKKDDRPESDFYETPKSLVWELLKLPVLSGCKTILEPCCGDYAISSELEKYGYEVTAKDIKYGNDFLEEKYSEKFDAVVTNPPFSLFTDIVNKAKTVSNKVVVIGKTNFFGVHSRNIDGFWKHLKDVYIFDRQVEYRTPHREDGLFMVGCLVTGWFVWDMEYLGDPKLHIINVQDYAKLGSYDSFLKKQYKKNK